jgi:hypothetical protein
MKNGKDDHARIGRKILRMGGLTHLLGGLLITTTGEVILIFAFIFTPNWHFTVY